MMTNIKVIMRMIKVMMTISMILSLQALLYQQDNETVFTVEYDIAKQVILSFLLRACFVTHLII